MGEEKGELEQSLQRAREEADINSPLPPTPTTEPPKEVALEAVK